MPRGLPRAADHLAARASDYELGVGADPAQGRRGEGALEGQPDEVEPGDRAAFGEAGEHRPTVGSSRAHRGGVGPVVHDAPGLGDVEEAPEWEAVEAGDREPEVEVPPEDDLGHEADRGAGGEGGLSDPGQLAGELHGGVPGAHNYDALPPER